MQPQPQPQPQPPLTPLSPWLVRMFCEDCNAEHYRYFNTSQTCEKHVTLGQCSVCFIEREAAMQLLNLIPQPLGQNSYYKRTNAQGSTDQMKGNFYTPSPDWRPTTRSQQEHIKFKDLCQSLTPPTLSPSQQQK